MHDDTSRMFAKLSDDEIAVIDSACDRFEKVWRGDQRPNIESFVEGFEDQCRLALLIELVALEIDLRRKAGERADLDEYLERFAELSTVEDQLAARLGETECPETVNRTDDATPNDGSESNHSTPSCVGRKLGRFELLAELGSGAFGTVYRAHDTLLDRDVALKIPRSGSFASSKDEERFLREARAAGQLHHPNIVPIHEAGQVDQLHYIASEYIPGRTLGAELRDEKPRTHRELCELIAKLANALNYAHGKGIIHRDIKPENIILDEAGEPLILDFGLARCETAGSLQTGEGVILGTLPYMSPEQTRGEAYQADGRSDLWSLGVVFYEMLTGTRPFQGEGVDLLGRIAGSEPSRPRKLDPSIPKDLDTICLKCLAKDTNDRFSTCGDLADELHRWLRGEPVRSRPIGIVGHTWRWCRRNPKGAAAVSVILLLITAASAALVSNYVQTLKRLDTERELNAQTQKTLAAERDLSTEREQNLQKMRELVDENMTAIAQHPELIAKDVEKVRLGILIQVTKFYDDMAEQWQDDKEVLAEQARARLNLASLYRDMNKPAEAFQEYDRSLELFRRLGRGDDADPRHLKRFITVLLDSGRLHQGSGRPDIALRHFREAEQIVERLCLRSPHDIDCRWLSAGIRYSRATVYADQGNPAAESEYVEAMDILEVLVPKTTNTVVINLLAATKTALAKLYNGEDRRPKDILRLETEALGLYGRLVQADPNNPTWRDNLANGHMNIASTHVEIGAFKAAVEALKKAEEIRLELAQTHPDRPHFRAGLYKVRRVLGHVLSNMGRSDEAIGLLKQAITDYSQLAAEHPDVIGFGLAHANASYTLASVYRQADKPEKAATAFKESAALYRTLASRVPEDNEPYNRHIGSLEQRSEILHELNRTDEALLEWDQAIRDAAGVQRLSIQHRRGLFLARIGRHADATAAADAILAEFNNNGNACYCAAALCAQAAGGLDKAESLTKEDIESLRAKYKDQAIKLLQKADQKGAFNEPGVRSSLASNPDFDPLRDLDAFKALLLDECGQ